MNEKLATFPGFRNDTPRPGGQSQDSTTAKRRAQRGLDSGHAAATLLVSGVDRTTRVILISLSRSSHHELGIVLLAMDRYPPEDAKVWTVV